MIKCTSLSFIFLCVLLLTSISPSAAQIIDNLDPVPDRKCDTGRCAGDTCCPAGCKKCGGPACRRNNPTLKRQCCVSWINRLNPKRPCSLVGPPCIVDRPLKCTGIKANKPEKPNKPIDPEKPNQPDDREKPNDIVRGPGKWTAITNELDRKPTARHENCFVMGKGKGFLIGGRGKRPVQMFDPFTKKWSKVADMPTQMHHMQCVYHDGFIYIPTSWFGRSPSEKNNEDMWAFNVKTFEWIKMKGLPEKRRRGGAGAVIFKNRIYVIAGNRGGHGPPSESNGWVDYYDLRKERWVTELASLPAGHERDHVGAAVVGDKICIAGGRNGGMPSPFRAVVTSTWCYDPAENQWENMNAPIPAGRAGAATGSMCDGRMILVGGEGRFSKAFDRVDVFNGKKWDTLDPIVRSRHGTGLGISDCSKCDHIFITAGSGKRGGRPELDSTERFVPTGSRTTCRAY